MTASKKPFAAPAKETLRQKQSRFGRMTVALLTEMADRGYEWTYGEAFRSEWEATRLAKKGLGIKQSLHCERLALDINLFKDGTWLTKTEDHRPFGEFWETLGGSWGGRFNDGNHYSLSHEGRK